MNVNNNALIFDKIFFILRLRAIYPILTINAQFRRRFNVKIPLAEKFPQGG